MTELLSFSLIKNEHLSEYVAWYRKRPEELAQWIDLGVWINGETVGYLRVWDVSTEINIPQVGDLPLGCAAVCSQSIWVQRLAVEATVHADIKLLRQALLMDPLTGAVCTPAEIMQMADEMLIEEAQWLPQYAEEIEKAKERF